MSERRQLLQQAVHIPECDLYLKSTHQHDYTSHTWTDTEGKKRTYAVDGGTAYCRRAGDLSLIGTKVIEWSLYDGDPFDTIAAKMLWGTRGPKGDQPLRHLPISTLTLPHLQAILLTQFQIQDTIVERVVQHWVKIKS